MVITSALIAVEARQLRKMYATPSQVTLVPSSSLRFIPHPIHDTLEFQSLKELSGARRNSWLLRTGIFSGSVA